MVGSSGSLPSGWVPSGCVPSGSVSSCVQRLLTFCRGGAGVSGDHIFRIDAKNSVHSSEHHRASSVLELVKGTNLDRKHSDSIVVFDDRGSTSITWSFFVF